MERIVQTFFFFNCLYKLDFPQTTLPNFHWILGGQYCRFWEVNHGEPLLEPPCRLSIGVVRVVGGPGRISLVLPGGWFQEDYVQWCSSGRSFHVHGHVVWAPRKVTPIFWNCFAKVIYLSQVYTPSFSFWRTVIKKISISNWEFNATICCLFIGY